jgi:hypothetical protein
MGVDYCRVGGVVQGSTGRGLRSLILDGMAVNIAGTHPKFL